VSSVPVLGTTVPGTDRSSLEVSAATPEVGTNAPRATSNANARRAHWAQLPILEVFILAASDLSKEQQHNEDDHDDAQAAARPVTPTPTVTPGRQNTDESEDEND
jgi:hypothetical protein